jgi:hypothetical protein
VAIYGDICTEGPNEALKVRLSVLFADHEHEKLL